MANKQYFGIKYPFTDRCVERYEFDLNNSEHEKMTSELLHLIFTPKGQRLRLPNFGTNLVKFIFEATSDSWAGVKEEIQETVNEWLKDIILNDINILASEDGREIKVKVDYTIKEGIDSYDYSIVVDLN